MKINFSFEEKKIAITGASGGLGKVLSEKLIRMGAQVEKIPRNTQWDPGAFQFIFLNAGFGLLQKADNELHKDVEDMFKVNVLETIRRAQEALHKGCQHVHIVGSVLSHISSPHFAIYSATKHAVKGWAYGAARELPGRVSISYPNGMKTNFFSSLKGEEELLEKYSQGFKVSQYEYDIPETVADGILEGIVYGAREIIPSGFALAWFKKNEVDIRRMWYPGLKQPSQEKYDWWNEVYTHWKKVSEKEL